MFVETKKDCLYRQSFFTLVAGDIEISNLLAGYKEGVLLMLFLLENDPELIYIVSALG